MITYSRDVGRSEVVVSESQEETCLAHSGVSDQDEFDQVVKRCSLTTHIV